MDMGRKKIEKMKKMLAYFLVLRYNTVCCVDGLSPNGKAPDSDSVIVKVRILLAQLEKSR